jgi:hypothetical protein
MDGAISVGAPAGAEAMLASDRDHMGRAMSM